jgi:quinoprotein dehydrogenase-associated probable ABC transporter substrate-binding protein
VCVSSCARSEKTQITPKLVTVPATQPRRILRIAADPNNLPFTNDRLEGFENRIAQIVADDLGARIEYTWRAQRRGFFRETLKENRADLVLGVPAGFDMALTTKPYYRSTYVFVSRKDRNLNVQSLDDPKLRSLKVGVQIVGNDSTNTPPAHALTRRGMVDNLVGYTLYGDYREDSPPARILEAVARGDIDLAVVWGPLAGYFAKRQPIPLELAPVTPAIDPPYPFTFAIAMGVRKPDKALRDELNAVLARRRGDIEKILDDYGVPRVAAATTQPAISER